MLTSDLIRKTRQIEIRTRHLVNDTFAGQYQAIFKGHGIEFNEVRPYNPGDDIRTIDWKVTARTGTPYVRRHIEERQLTVMLIVDASGSGDFGTANQFKRELAAELAAVLSFAATTANDKVGLLFFTDQVELFVPPRKGRKHVTRIIREILAFEPKRRATHIGVALETINRVLKRRSIMFLVSDFLAPLDSYRQALYVTNRRHDVVAVDLQDPMESEIPDVGVIAVEDAEDGRLSWVDTSDPAWRSAFANRVHDLEVEKKSMFASANVDRIQVKTDQDYIVPLIAFFKRRARRLTRTRPRPTGTYARTVS